MGVESETSYGKRERLLVRNRKLFRVLNHGCALCVMGGHNVLGHVTLRMQDFFFGDFPTAFRIFRSICVGKEG